MSAAPPNILSNTGIVPVSALTAETEVQPTLIVSDTQEPKEACECTKYQSMCLSHILMYIGGSLLVFVALIYFLKYRK